MYLVRFSGRKKRLLPKERHKFVFVVFNWFNYTVGPYDYTASVKKAGQLNLEQAMKTQKGAGV